MLLFLSFIFYDKAMDEKAYIRNNIFLEMKNYSMNFKDKRFFVKKVKKEKNKKFYTLYEDEKSLYILVPLPNTQKKDMMMVMGPVGVILVPYSKEDREVQKIWYPKKAYEQRLKQMYYRLAGQFVLFAFVALLFALLAAWYTLKPLRGSLRLLEDFIKDIIHDLNTPLGAILLNLKMIESKSDEIESIRTAAQTIEMLHHNLGTYLNEQKQAEECFELNELIDANVAFFASLYEEICWNVNVEELRLCADKQAFGRIIYNLLSNACKYNVTNGHIDIIVNGTTLTIRNSSYGVVNPNRVFERFYKESERGLGIGLHIVDKLCESLKIKKEFKVEGTEVVVVLELENIADATPKA